MSVVINSAHIVSGVEGEHVVQRVNRIGPRNETTRLKFLHDLLYEATGLQ